MPELAPTRILGHVKRVAIDASNKVGTPPKVTVTVDVSGYDGRELNGLVGVLSNIEVTPIQQTLGV